MVPLHYSASGQRSRTDQTSDLPASRQVGSAPSRRQPHEVQRQHWDQSSKSLSVDDVRESTQPSTNRFPLPPIAPHRSRDAIDTARSIDESRSSTSPIERLRQVFGQWWRRGPWPPLGRGFAAQIEACRSHAAMQRQEPGEEPIRRVCVQPRAQHQPNAADQDRSSRTRSLVHRGAVVTPPRLDRQSMGHRDEDFRRTFESNEKAGPSDRWGQTRWALQDRAWGRSARTESSIAAPQLSHRP